MAENTKIIISAVDKTKKGFGSVTSGLKKVTGAVFSMRTALVGVAGIAGFGLLVRSSLNATDSLAKTASKIGTTTEALSALRYAADVTGVATTTMDMALQRFTRRTAEAAKGTGEAKGAIKELGISAQQLNNMPLDQRMLVLADAFSNVKNESDRLRLAFKLFDSEGAALVNTLSLGREGLSELLGEAKALGVVMSSDAAKGVEDASDALTRLKAISRGLRDQFVAALAPAIEALTTRFTLFFKEISNKKGGVEKFAKEMAVSFLNATVAVVESLDIILTNVGKTFEFFRKKVSQFSSWANKTDLDDFRKRANNLSDAFEDLSQGATLSSSQIHSLGLGGLAPTLDNIKMKYWEFQALIDETEAKITGGMSAIDFSNIIDLPAFKEQIKGLIALTEEVKTAVGAVVTPEGAESLNFYGRAVEALKLTFEDFKKTLPTLEEGMTSLTNNAMGAFTKGFTDAITGAEKFSDAMKTMAKSVIDSLIQMLVQYYITQQIFGAITSMFPTGGGGTSTAPNTNMGANLTGGRNFDGGGYTGNGSRSGGMDGKGGFMAMLHPQETVIDHTKNTNNLSKTADQIQSFQNSNSDRFKSLGRGGLNETIENENRRSIHSNNLNETIDNKDLRSFDGGGFTGNGSRSGGVDGKGGFNAILHPNETVTDHTKSINKKRNERENTNEENNSIVVNQTINVTTGVQQTVRAEIVQLMPQIAQAAKGAVADARLRGGNFSKAMGGA